MAGKDQKVAVKLLDRLDLSTLVEDELDMSNAFDLSCGLSGRLHAAALDAFLDTEVDASDELLARA